jgi:hypothetical protein
MQCIKTGCVAHLTEYGEDVYGDAYETASGDLVIRCAGRALGKNEYGDRRHFTVLKIDHWFDDRVTSMGHNSTLIAERGMFNNHGYEGVVID